MNIILLIFLFFISCSAPKSVHENNLYEQNKRMEKFDEASRKKQQYIRSSNASNKKSIRKRKPKIRKFIS
jgi:hypothetical protein